jgi:hypothetical protein
MFSSLNDEVRKQEVVGPLIARTLRFTALLTVSIVGFSALYAGMLLLAIGSYLIRKDSVWKSRRFSTT